MSTNKKIAVIALTVFFLFFFHSNGLSQRVGVKSLTGIEEIGVVVEQLDKGLENLGLSPDEIKTDVELKLQRAGIKVSQDAMSYLYVYVSAYWHSKSPEIVAINISLDFRQFVLLPRSKDTVYATTWTTGAIGISGTQKVSGFRKYIEDEVDIFINDYLLVNPAKKK